MTASPSSDTVTPAALSAFLRGIERRGAALAWLQCGDQQQGEYALLAAIRAFSVQAAKLPMADWPLRFWTLLAATPQLEGAGPQASWPDGLQTMRHLDARDRLALLLRIVAGLDEQPAGQVLSIDLDAYRDALARACPRDARGRPDAAGWRALAETAQRLVRAMPEAWMQRLAELRESAVRGALPKPHPAAGKSRPAAATATPKRAGRGSERRARRSATTRWWWVVALLVIAVAVAGVAYLDQRRSAADAAKTLDREGRPTIANPVQVEPLPDADVSAAPDEPAQLSAAEQSMLADPQFELAQQADFYAWVAAGSPQPKDDAPPAEQGDQAVGDASPSETVMGENE